MRLHNILLDQYAKLIVDFVFDFSIDGPYESAFYLVIFLLYIKLIF